MCGRGPFGGSGGSAFSDAGYAGDRITRVDVRSAKRVDGLDQLVAKILSEEDCVGRLHWKKFFFHFLEYRSHMAP